VNKKYIFLKNVKKPRRQFTFLRHTSPNLALNVALIVATTDTEETVLSPVSVPRVGASPVFDTVLLTIADNLDSVTTLITTAGVVIDTRGVAHEIRVDSEGNLEGTVLDELGLHAVLTIEGVGLRALVLISVPVSTIASALLLAFRSRHAGVTAGSVRIALVSHNTNIDPVGPGATRLTALARTTARPGGVRAAVDIFSRKTDGEVLVDAITIAHGFSSTESPAGTALSLIADLLDGGARGPFSTSIKSSRGSSLLLLGELLDSPAVGMEVLHVDTKETTSLALGHTGNMIVSSLPHILLLVDLTDHAGADSDLFSKSDCSDNCNNKGNLVHIGYYFNRQN